MGVMVVMGRVGTAGRRPFVFGFRFWERTRFRRTFRTVVLTLVCVSSLFLPTFAELTD